MESDVLSIGMTCLDNDVRTLGLDILSQRLATAGHNPAMVTRREAKGVDVLLVSLYWVDQVLKYPQWLIEAQINPAHRRPIIIIGGSMSLNPYPLRGMFHYAVFGDGEDVIVDLINALSAQKEPESNSVVRSEDEQFEGLIAVTPQLPMNHYIENRQAKITRIEIARGCKRRCRFCQIAHIKPYREIPPVVLKNLIATAPTKRIALFSPDRGSYSAYENIELWCKKYGKRNCGTDITLSAISKTTIATSIRFGLEGFSERERKLVGKPYSNGKIQEDIIRILTDVKTPKGKPSTVLTCYMILGIPGQTEKDYAEFAVLLRSIDDECVDRSLRMTFFLSCSDFLPSNHTPFERESKDILTDHYALWKKHKPFLKNIVIAERGGTRSPTMRVMQLLIMRGGANSEKGLFNASLHWAKLLRSRKMESAERLICNLNTLSIDTQSIINGWEKDQPWDNIQLDKTAWKQRNK